MRDVTLRVVIALCMSASASLVFSQEIDHSQHRHESATPTTNSTSEVTTDHVAPDPPEHVMGDMSYREMVDVMQMDDKAPKSRVLIDQAEWRHVDASEAAQWDATFWYGGDFNKAMIKTEGERAHGSTEHARVELLWDRAYARWWNGRLGVRQDIDAGPARTWAALGIEGLAPYWFDVEAMLYVGSGGRTALRVDVDYELLLTQRLILRPAFEANAYSQADDDRHLGSGLSSIDVSLRLRYEVHRQFAPYVGFGWQRKFGGTEDYALAAGEDAREAYAIAGVRVWF
jgi:copper resistance protein B